MRLSKFRLWAARWATHSVGRLDALLPGGDGGLVEFEEDAFTSVLGAYHPGGVGGCQRRPSRRQVEDAVHLVDAGEPDQSSGLAQLLDGEHAADGVRHPRVDTTIADGQAADGIFVMLAGGVLLR